MRPMLSWAVLIGSRSAANPRRLAYEPLSTSAQCPRGQRHERALSWRSSCAVRQSGDLGFLGVSSVRVSTVRLRRVSPVPSRRTVAGLPDPVPVHRRRCVPFP